MPRGGPRPNQTGRPKGAATKRTRKIAVQAALTGQTPLEVMLEVMRKYIADGNGDKAAAIAKDAAPYMHPRLASVEHAGKGGGPIESQTVIILPSNERDDR